VGRFCLQSASPPVYIFYHEGKDKPLQDQLDIIDTLPGEKGYDRAKSPIRGNQAVTGAGR
jgi:hypothetical protein